MRAADSNFRHQTNCRNQTNRERMTVHDPPWREIAHRLVGVIDLKSGLAVHGVAGQRDNYSPVRLSCFRCGALDGDPLHLLAHYQELGLKRFYIADLNSLGGGEIQQGAIEAIVEQAGPDARWIIDAGLSDPSDTKTTQWLDRLTGPDLEAIRGSIHWVVASESAINLDVASGFAQILGARRVILGIDFRSGQFMGPLADESLDGLGNDSSLVTWVQRSADAGIRSVLILDVAAVGTSQGPVSLANCRRFRRDHGDWEIISGGGCRSPADARAFLDAGCSDCMVATALHC